MVAFCAGAGCRLRSRLNSGNKSAVSWFYLLTICTGNLSLVMTEVIVHRSARYSLYFVVGTMLLVWRPALSLRYSVEGVLLKSQATVRLVQQQCDHRIGPFAKQDTAWSRWREAQGQGYAVSAGVDACYNASGTKGYCFNILSC
jgi:hypothetical protein